MPVLASDYLAKVRSIGGAFEPEKGGTNYISDVYFAKNGDVYLCDNSNHKDSSLRSNGKFKDQFGTFGSATGQLNYPLRVAADTDGTFTSIDSMT